MALLNIIKSDNPLIRKISKPVTNFDTRLHELLDDMNETMLYHNGVGIAGVQVGVLYRIALIETEKNGLIEIINPIITSAKRNKTAIEGCLSCPNINGRVRRPSQVTISFQDRNGKNKTLDLYGIDAICASHEIDHMDGILFIDKMEETK